MFKKSFLLCFMQIFRFKNVKSKVNIHAAATSRGIEILPDASFTSSSTARTFLPKASATSSPNFTATFSILDLILSSTR